MLRSLDVTLESYIFDEKKLYSQNHNYLCDQFTIIPTMYFMNYGQHLFNYTIQILTYLVLCMYVMKVSDSH